MRLAVSNIAWTEEQDREAYGLMKQYGFTGLEIAPTRVLPQSPYDRLEEARAWARELKEQWGFAVPSMQSIWFGRQEKLFGSQEERAALLDYTKKAMDFAEGIGCGNLVFGCPRNRALPEGASPALAVSFFRELGEYAQARGTALGLEPNPPIYHTNYLNDTPAALALIEEVGVPGVGLNLDMGTMIENGEAPELLTGRVGLISHVHISEPGLAPLKAREDLHRTLKQVLASGGYAGWVSIEMGKRESLDDLERAMAYVSGIFGRGQDGGRIAMICEKQPGVPKFEYTEFAPKQKDYVLLIPIINEGERIVRELERAARAQVASHVDIVICDGGSTDGCTEEGRLRALGVNSLLVKRDKGKQGAQLRMGIWWALERGYRGVVTIDGNDKDSIEDVPRFVEKLKEGYGLIQGSRFVKGGRAVNTPLTRLVSVRLIHAPVISLTARQWFTDTTNAYRGYSAEYLRDDRVQPLRDVFMTYELLAYLSVRATQLGYKACEIPVTRAYPKTGKTPTKISPFKGNAELMKILLKNAAGAYAPKF